MLLKSTNRIYLIVFLLLSCTILFSQSWYVVDTPSINGTPDFSDVHVVDENVAFISSSSQANIFRTDDGAVSFSIQTTSLGTSTGAIYMINASTGFCGGASGFVYNTNDSGNNWGFLGAMSATLTDMDFVSASQGYACGDGGAVYSILSTGVTNLNSGQASFFSGISSPSVDNVWVCGGGAILYYNGSTFSFQSGPAGSYNSIFFVNNYEGWVVGDSGVIGHTTNGGTSWTQQSNPSINALYDVFFLDANNGWAVGFNGIILSTTNGGDTWTIVGAGLTTAFLRGVHFTSPTNGYVVGNGKTLIKYGFPLATEDVDSVPNEFTLSQNHPNPFNPSTMIQYTLPEESNVTISIYNLLGKGITELTSKTQTIGSHSIQWDGTDQQGNQVPAGIYLYQLQAGDFSQTKKMVLMK